MIMIRFGTTEFVIKGIYKVQWHWDDQTGIIHEGNITMFCDLFFQHVDFFENRVMTLAAARNGISVIGEWTCL